MALLILLRHGQSAWNRRNRFTGWVDIPLSQKGIEEAFAAGEELADTPIHIIFTSTLSRGLSTALIAMTKHHSQKVPRVLHPGEGRLAEWGQVHCEEAREMTIPLIRAEELNERMYGDLQGLDKNETRKRFGMEQVERWRRSYDEPPPGGESLEMTAARVIPYFKETISPVIQEEGKNVLVSAHGNSLRALMMLLDGLTKEEVVKLEIPTGKPIYYLYESGNFTKRNRAVA